MDKFEPVKKEIDGTEYAVVRFTASRGLAVQAKIIKIFGSLLSATKGGELGVVAERFAEKLGEDGGYKLMVDLLKGVYRDGTRLTENAIDTIFAGDYIHLYKVALFVIEVNGFLGKVNILESLKSAVESTPDILTEKLVSNLKSGGQSGT